MPLVKQNPAVEHWLEADAESWRLLSDTEYTSLVAEWKATFWQLLELKLPRRTGNHALFALEELLPAQVFVLTGILVPALDNYGGEGACGYEVTALRGIDRDLANAQEIILAEQDMSYSCVFSHEAGFFVHEHLYVVDDDAGLESYPTS